MNDKQILDHTISENQRLQQSVNTLSTAYDTLVRGIGESVKQKYKSNYVSAIQKKSRSFPFIPYPPHSVTDQIYVAFRQLGHVWNKYKFLDAGCGIGNIMLLANKAGFLVYGLEIDPTLLTTASKINRNMFFSMKKQNIMTYKDYGEYDVIYYYCPFSCNTKEKVFEKYVENQMKIGAIIIPNFKQSNKINRDKRFKCVPVGDDRNPIYIKIKA